MAYAQTPPTRRYLVTAGSTRERIDEVRDWGNIFTGATGLSIARALSHLGSVDLVTANRQHGDLLHRERELGLVRVSNFATHAELRTELDALMQRHRYDGIYMCAAVSDYRPEGAFTVLRREPTEAVDVECWYVRAAQAPKVQSTHPQIAILGARTEKLVDLFRTRWGHTGLLVKFKLEVGISVESLLAIGRRSRITSGADYLVANTLDMVQGLEAGAYLIGDGSEEWVSRGSLATRLACLAEDHARNAGEPLVAASRTR